jgi:formylmethanofuran dehydrogenase subunit E-like metal-binding protein
MSKKNKNKEEYRTLVGALDILTKNYQLLTGGVTSRNVFVLPSEVMDKNNIQSSGHDDEKIITQ